MVEDLLALFFPELCLACEEPLVSGEQHCCTDCRVNLPYLDYHLRGPHATENPLAARFWGKVTVCHALAYLRFSAQGRVQHLLHQLKYERQPEIGQVLGMWFGSDLAQCGYSQEFDMVVPVPMHPAKERKRGYNQAACFGEGIAAGLLLPHHPKALTKVVDTGSQTRRDRLARWQNTQEGFAPAHPEEIADKRVLLVDDVLTTGATLEACATTVLAAGALSVSVATIAAAG